MLQNFFITRRMLIILLVIFSTFKFYSQATDKFYQATVAFYNLENLFDTLNDVTIDDEEFLPESDKAWNGKKYFDKLDKLSEVIEKLGDNDGAEILGVSEVENKRVLEDLCATKKLKPLGYGIAHIESPDKRGIDVALLYKKKYFFPITISSVELNDTVDKDFKTRNLIVVKGRLVNDTITFIVGHWPSRRGGHDDSKRVLVAKLARHIIDSITKEKPNSKIILMGDLNDDPDNRSIYEFLDAKPEKKMQSSSLFNPMYNIIKKGYGTLMHKGSWNLFDQIILSKSLLNDNDTKFYYLKESASIFYKKWLINKEGRYEGGPFRTWSGNEYIGGYSDHLPVFLSLVQKVKN